MASPIHVVSHVTALPGKEESLKVLLRELVEATRAEAGCRRYELWENSVDPTQFVFVEEWESDEAFNAHLDSAHVQEAFREGEDYLAAPPEMQRYGLVR